MFLGSIKSSRKSGFAILGSKTGQKTLRVPKVLWKHPECPDRAQKLQVSTWDKFPLDYGTFFGSWSFFRLIQPRFGIGNMHFGIGNMKKNVFTNSVLFHPKWSKNDLDTIGIGLGLDFYYLFHFLVAKITSLGSEKSYFWGRKNIFASIFLSHPKWCKNNPNTMGISLGSVFVTFWTFSLRK